MKTKSAKQKGARFERYIAKQIEEAGLGKAGREGNSGAGFRKGDIASSLPFLLEAKNEKQTNFLPNVDQAKHQAEIGNWNRSKWCLITRDPRTPEDRPEVYATIDFWELLNLLKRNEEPKVKAPDREMRWLLIKLKQVCSEIIKII